MSNELNDLSRQRDIVCYEAFGTLRALLICGRTETLPQWAQQRIAEHVKRYDEIDEQLDARFNHRAA